MPVTRISAEPACSAKVGASRWMRGHVFVADRAGFVDRLADHIHDAAQRGGADRHADGPAGVDHFLAAHQAFGGVHGDGAHGVFAQMLGDFEHQADFLAGLGVDVGGFQRVQDRGQVPPSNSTSTTAPMTWSRRPLDPDGSSDAGMCVHGL